MVELLFLCTLSRGMKDCYLTTLFSLGEASVCYESVTLRYICLPIYSNTVRFSRQPFEDERLYLSLKGCLGTLCLGLRRKSLLRSLRNLRWLLISERSIFNTVVSIAWFHLPVGEIHLSICEHLFQFLNCQADLHRFVSCLVINVIKILLYHIPLKEKRILLYFSRGSLRRRYSIVI